MNTEKMVNTENATSHNFFLPVGVLSLGAGGSDFPSIDLGLAVALLVSIAVSVRMNLLRHQNPPRRPSKVHTLTMLVLTSAVVALGVFVLASA